MHRKVLVAALVTVVLRDVVQVLPANDHSAGHLSRDDLAAEDTATDRDQTSPWALLVYTVLVFVLYQLFARGGQGKYIPI